MMLPKTARGLGTMPLSIPVKPMHALGKARQPAPFCPHAQHAKPASSQVACRLWPRKELIVAHVAPPEREERAESPSVDREEVDEEEEAMEATAKMSATEKRATLAVLGLGVITAEEEAEMNKLDVEVANITRIIKKKQHEQDRASDLRAAITVLFPILWMYLMGK